MRGLARVAPGACGGGGDREEGDVAFSAGDFFFSFGVLELDLFVLSSSRASPFSLSFT
jgi:hypothetical protein